MNDTRSRNPRTSLRVLAIMCFVLVPLLALSALRGRAEGTTVTLPVSPDADSFVAEGKDQNFGSRPGLWVGYDPGGGYLEEQALLKFAVDSIPNDKVVKGARLKLWLSGTVGTQAVPISTHLVLSDWIENEVTWNSRPPVEKVASDTQDVGTTFGWYTWTVTSDWQKWKQSGASYPFSLLLKGPGNIGQNERAFWSRDCQVSGCQKPVLELELESATPTPTATPVGPWAAWRDSSMITVSEAESYARFTRVVLDYGNSAALNPNLSATVISGPVQFDTHGMKDLTVPLPSSNGTYTLTVYAETGANRGERFRLNATVSEIDLGNRDGVIVGPPTYLPFIGR